MRSSVVVPFLWLLMLQIGLSIAKLALLLVRLLIERANKAINALSLTVHCVLLQIVLLATAHT